MGGIAAVCPGGAAGVTSLVALDETRRETEMELASRWSAPVVADPNAIWLAGVRIPSP